MVHVKIFNKGYKPAEDAAFNFAAPKQVRIAKSDRHGNFIHADNALIEAKAPYGNGDPMEWHSWNQQVTFPPRITIHFHFRLSIDDAGTYPVAAMVRHHELPDEGALDAAEIVIPERPA